MNNLFEKFTKTRKRGQIMFWIGLGIGIVLGIIIVIVFGLCMALDDEGDLE